MGGILVGGDDMLSGSLGAQEGVGDDFGLWGGSMNLPEDNPDHPISFLQQLKQPQDHPHPPESAVGGILVGGDDMLSGRSGAHEGVGDDFGLWDGSMDLPEDNPDHPTSWLEQLNQQLEQQLKQLKQPRDHPYPLESAVGGILIGGDAMFSEPSGAHEGVGDDLGLRDGLMDMQLDDTNHLGPQDGAPQDQSAEGTNILGAMGEDEAVVGPEHSSLEPTLATTTARDGVRC